ncbi:hypothetical protein D1BOALGB6SA_2129 [Olavius sp. associated proteobacterium Delta 1]|nr:hypothetical protein D1BOALGB6SA_2129 [Olavius sp. associated proteobacterium Delta 1]
MIELIGLKEKKLEQGSAGGWSSGFFSITPILHHSRMQKSDKIYLTCFK